MRDSWEPIEEVMGEMRCLTTRVLRALECNDAAAVAHWTERRRQVRAGLERACQETASAA